MECTHLHEIILSLARHSFPTCSAGIPTNGLYFLFEAGETGHEGDRLVRIGSHTGNGNLAARLREHMTQNKDRSIFRKNIGRALLARNRDPYLDVWELDLTKREDRNRYAPLVNLTKQNEVEQSVSDYVAQHMSVSVIATPNRDLALLLERLCIATVSLCQNCCASSAWLGRFSPKQKIRTSGLWQVQHLSGQPLSAADLHMVEELAVAAL